MGESEHQAMLKSDQDIIQQLRDLDLLHARIEDVQTLIDLAFNETWILPFELFDRDWYRGRRCESPDGWSDLNCLKYPPPGKVELGRANQPKQPVLYASSTENTVFSELNLAIGDRVQVVSFSYLEPSSLCKFSVIGELELAYKSGVHPLGNQDRANSLTNKLDEVGQHERLRVVLADAFRSEQFRKRVGVDNSFEYKITSAMSRQFFAGVEGFIFPSTQNFGGVNCAIVPEAFDAKFRVSSSTMYEIVDAIGYGLYGRKVLGRSKEIREDGTIIWE